MDNPGAVWLPLMDADTVPTTYRGQTPRPAPRDGRHSWRARTALAGVAAAWAPLWRPRPGGAHRAGPGVVCGPSEYPTRSLPVVPW